MNRSAIVGAACAVAIVASTAIAQQQQASGPPVAAVVNPQVALPYGAPSAAPVSKWTPPASVGRQLTLNDLLTWKGIRTPQLSNDGKWVAYILAPNEGDAEVVARGTAADAKEMRFTIGEPPAAAAGARALSGSVVIPKCSVTRRYWASTMSS